MATNALLQRKGARHALLITKGFKDLLSIGNQTRPRIFDLDIKRPSRLYDDVIEVDERVTLVGYSSDPEAERNSVGFDEDGKVMKNYSGEGLHNGLGGLMGKSGEAVHVLKELDEDEVYGQLDGLHKIGYSSVAVVLAHS